MSTEPLFVPALASLDGLVPHERLLTPDELEGIARDLAASTELWQPLVHSDAERRRYELIYEDDRMDAWILSRMPGQGTGFHDHYISGVAPTPCAIASVERRTWSSTERPSVIGGSAHDESPECTPASSMCSITPPMKDLGAVAERVDVDLDGVVEEPVDEHRPAGADRGGLDAM